MCLSYSQINKIFIVTQLYPLYCGYFANSEDSDEMHFIRICTACLKIKDSGTEKKTNSENSTCDPLKYTMGSPILYISIQ